MRRKWTHREPTYKSVKDILAAARTIMRTPADGEVIFHILAILAVFTEGLKIHEEYTSASKGIAFINLDNRLFEVIRRKHRDIWDSPDGCASYAAGWMLGENDDWMDMWMNDYGIEG